METIEEIIRRIQTNIEARKPEESSQSQNYEARHSNFEKFFREAKVPVRHRDFDPIETKTTVWGNTYEKAIGVFGKGGIVALIGNRGTGKTQMAVCIVREWCKTENTARYVKAMDFFLAIRSSFKDDDVSENDVLNIFMTPRLLVVDALEERGETPWEDRMLSHLIDRRYDDMKETILISNQKPEAFDVSIGPSIVSRLNETGGKIIFDWESFRK